MDVNYAAQQTPQLRVLSDGQIVRLYQATLVHDVGFLDCANTGSLEMLVMNDEIIAMTRRMMRGIEVTGDTLMLDLIDEVGPGAQFLSTTETARRCREEVWHPTLMDRENWENWAERGSQAMQERIRSRLQKILATHRPPPLADDVSERIQSVLKGAEVCKRNCR